MKQCLFWATIVLCVLASHARAERVIPTASTEQLALEAGLIVEGTLGETWTEHTQHYGKADVHRFRVTEVIAGPMPERRRTTSPRDPPASQPAPVKAGDVIAVSGISKRYTITSDLLGGAPRRPLAAGDRLTLFLARKGIHFPGYAVDGATSAEWGVPANALRYHSGPHAYAFCQYWAPNAMGSVTITATRENFPDLDLLSRREFRARIRDALKEAPDMQASIDRATRADLDRLIEICRAGRKPLAGEVGRPYWPGWASAKIDEVADAEMIVGFFESPQAAASSGYWPSYVLASRSDCRERILQLVEGDTLSPERRQAACDRLTDGGHHYQHSLKDAVASQKPLPHDGRFARRLAAVAVVTADPRASADLFEAVRDCVTTPGYESSQALDQDLAAAADVLVASWPKLGPASKFEAAVALRFIGAAQAGRLPLKLGPFMTWIRIDDRDRRKVDPARRLAVDYRYRNMFEKDDPPARLSLVFRSVATAQEFEEPFDHDAPQRRSNGPRSSFGSWSGQVDVPVDVTAGVYDVFLRTRQGGKIIGDGIGFTYAVPEKAAAAK